MGRYSFSGRQILDFFLGTTSTLNRIRRAARLRENRCFKEDFARPLAQALKDRALRVWFDEFTLRVGDSLRLSFDKGLARSRYGVVIVSSAFLNKEWSQKELDGVIAREVDGHKVILPVWHNIHAATLRQHSPILADRLATSSSRGLPQVVDELLEAMK